jgi:hypothetical protein
MPKFEAPRRALRMTTKRYAADDALPILPVGVTLMEVDENWCGLDFDAASIARGAFLGEGHLWCDEYDRQNQRRDCASSHKESSL